MIHKMIVYNLFPLLAGRFLEWERHLERASAMGFNWVFVNPIQYPGFSGSLYSVKDYFSFNPLLYDPDNDLTPESQLREAVRQADALGMRMMIDLVINHCAVDSPLVTERPEWFVMDEEGQVAHPSCNENGSTVVWGDLALFNHKGSPDREGLYRYFMSIVEHQISLGFTAFRCDAAYQVPQEIWHRLITECRAKHPEVLFLAETLGCTPDETIHTARAGFDFIFNSSKWWDLSGKWLLDQYKQSREICPSIGFPESHDTVRLCEELNCNSNGLRQRYLVSALFSGGVMAPLGFEYGFRKRPHVVNSRPEDWEEDGIDITEFIRKVNAIKSSNMVFLMESPTEMPEAQNHSILLMLKKSTLDGTRALVIINKDIHNVQRFRTDNVRGIMRTDRPLRDISVEPLFPNEVPDQISLKLNPGQGLVLITI